MKALQLTVQAFGCYLEETSVDFSTLANRLFLITGATGGGKTTLLDAICFALYCRATGGRRTWLEMRSISAPRELPTFVDYTFSLGEERYRFRRTLRMHKVRGSDRIEARDEHECFRWREEDWELLAAGAESKVREYAQRLLGLTCEQFSQVIVLPQGEFRRLLLSNSSEKTRIFQTLFQTQRWERVARCAKNNTGELKKQLDRLFAGQEALLAREGAKTTEQLAELCAQIRQEQAAADLRAVRLEEELKSAGAKLDEARQTARRIARREELSEKRRTLLSSQKQMEKNRLHLEQSRRAAACLPYAEQGAAAARICAQRENAAQKARAEAEAAGRALDYLKEILSLSDKAEKVNRMSGLFPEVADAQKALRDTHAALEGARLAFAEAEKNAAAGEEYLEGIHREAGALSGYIERASGLQAAKAAYLLLHERQSQAENARQAHSRAAHEEVLAGTGACALNEKLTAASALLQSDMAAALAHTLRSGSPCPVCGAKEHPSPALPCGEAPTKEELARLREAADAAQQKHAACLAAVSAREEALKLQTRLLIEQEAAVKQLGISEEQLEAELPGALKTLEEARARQAKLPRARQLLARRKEEKEAARNKQEECRLRIGALSAELESSMERRFLEAKQRVEVCGAALHTAESELKEAAARREETGERLETACREAGLLSSELQTLCLSQEQAGRLEKSIREYETACRATEEELRSLSEELQETEPPPLPQLETAYAALLSQSRDAASQQGSLAQRAASLAGAVEECRRQEAESAALQKEYSANARLSQLLAGTNAAKVPLAMFVLGIMLDDILSRANVYFSTLSNGRYALSRQEESGGGRGYSGLELTVFDGFSGGARAVDTLSGGELFLASLSLAFGLSDVVQSYSGGVRLDSLFIDEGFGTLDQETLDTAMKALDEIQRSGRTVGIISHVSELKNRIGCRLVVGQNKEGGATVRIEE